MTKIIAIMMGCQPGWTGPRATLAACLLLAAAGPALAAQRRAAVLMWAEDAFSQRPAAVLEQLGHEWLERRAELEAVAVDALVADEPPAAQRRALQRAAEQRRAGITAYEQLEPRKAVASLQAAVQSYEQAVPLLRGPVAADYLSTLSYLAASLVLTGDMQQGQATFRKLLIVEPTTELDKRLFPPGMVRLFAAARQEQTAAATGALAVHASPEHAKVFVDGRFRGVAPCSIDGLAAGRHLVVVRKAGHRPWGAAVTVAAATESPVRCRLQRAPAGEAFEQALAAAAAQVGAELAPRLQGLALGRGLDRLALGRLSQAGDGVAYTLSWYAVASGQPLREHAGILVGERDTYAGAVESLFTYLITGRGDVLQSAALAERDEPEAVRLRDEALFEPPEVPVYERWYFWTAVGAVVVGAAAVTLGLLLPGDESPGSQILLEF